MKIELLLRGRPSRMRFAEWQQANSMPDDKLPSLTEDQKARVRQLHISDREYAVALKAAQFAGERASEKMERVARLIAETARKRHPVAEVKSVLWDFYEQRFEFVARFDRGEYANSIPTQIIDDVLMEKEGAEQRLKNAVDFELGGWAD